MNRRQAFKTLAALVPAAAVTSVAASTPKKYGHVTLETHIRHKALTGEDLHVWLDGEDVTRYCRFADDGAGVVNLIATDESQFRRWHAKGGIYVDRWEMEVRGNVLIAPGVNL